MRAIPSLLDPLAPKFVRKGQIEHRFSLETTFRTKPKLQAEFNKLMTDVGKFVSIKQTLKPSELKINAALVDGFTPIPFGLPSVPPPEDQVFLPQWPSIHSVSFFNHHNHKSFSGFVMNKNRVRAVTYENVIETDDAATNEPQIPVLSESSTAIDPILVSVPMGYGDYLVAIYGVEHRGSPIGLAYRTLRGITSSGTWSEAHFTPQKRIDQIRGKRPGTLRRRIDFAYARTNSSPLAIAGRGTLHIFNNSLAFPGDAALGARDSVGFDPFPDTNSPQMPSLNHVRYGVLRMEETGTLSAVSERPVILSETAVSVPSDAPDGWTASVGAAQILQHRGLIRYFLPNGSEIGVKTKLLQ